MKELKGTQTEKNLQTAFAGESQAHTKYLYYASKAKKDGYVQMGDIFEETARNEKEHAKIWYKLINDGVGSTEENLKDAASGENEEWTSMYPEFAKNTRHTRNRFLHWWSFRLIQKRIRNQGFVRVRIYLHEVLLHM